MSVTSQKHIFISLGSFFKKANSVQPEKHFPKIVHSYILGAGVYYRSDTDSAVFHLIVNSKSNYKKIQSQLAVFVKKIKGDLLEYKFSDKEDHAQVFMKLYASYPVRYPGVDTFERAWKLLCQHYQAVNDNSLAPETRFKRDHQWVEARIQNISPNSIAIATGGPPRIGDATTIEIDTPKGPFCYRAEVKRHFNSDPHNQGIEGFIAEIKFGSSNVQLQSQILTWAQRSMLDAKPIPQRYSARVPIKWSASLVQNGHEHPVLIKDISLQGVFLETEIEAIGQVELKIPLDDKTLPIRMHGTVRRTRRSKEGKGLGIFFPTSDQEHLPRFTNFAKRVEKRAKHRIVLVSQGERLAGFTKHFSSVGYLVETIEKPRYILNRIREMLATPDLIILDRAIPQSSMEIIKRRLSRLKFDIYETEDNPWNTRSLIDAAFLA